MPNGTIWAVNNSVPAGESVLRSTDDGLSWARALTVKLTSTDCCGLAASYFLGADDAWAVDEVLHGDGIGETTTVYGTSDGGEQWWRSKGLPGDLTTAGAVPLFDQLYFANPEDGWLLGTGEDVGPQTIVLLWWRTTDGGRTWAAMPDGTLPMQGRVVSESSPCPSASPPHLTFATEGTGWLTEGDCAEGRARPLVWRTTDGGRQWAPVTLAAPAGGWGKWYVDGKGGTDLGAVSVMSADHTTVLLVPVATGSSGLVVERSTDLGRTWAVASNTQLPALPEDGTPANWFDPLTARQWVEAMPSGVMETADGGRSWQLVRSFLGLAGTPVVSFTSLRRGFVLGDNLTVVSSTDDYGRTWQPEEIPAALYARLAGEQGPPIDFVQQLGPGLAMASGYSGLWISGDSGRSWAERLGPATPVSQLDVAGPDLDFVLAGGEILRSEDNGLQWARLLQPAAGPALGVDFWSADAGVAFVDGNYVADSAYYVTFDAGAHWARLQLPAGWNFTGGVVSDGGLGSVCFSGDGTGWAAGTKALTSKAPGHPSESSSEAQLFVSTDGGRYWHVALPSSVLPKPNWAAAGGGAPGSGTGLSLAACQGRAAWAVSYQPAGLAGMQGVPVTFDLLGTTDLGASWLDVLRSPAYEKVDRPRVATPSGGPTPAVDGFATLVPQSLSAVPGTRLGTVWVTASNADLGGVAFAATDDAGTQWAQQYLSGQKKPSASPLPQEGWTSTSALGGQAAWALFDNIGSKGHFDHSLLYTTKDSGAHWSLLHTFTWPTSLLLPSTIPS
jgi:photosystem II stability/assembly factor-like uncharacterized protein